MNQPLISATDRRTLPAALAATAAARPDHPALIDEEGTSMTYGELLDASRSLAAGLLGLGVTPGDRVMLMLDNHCDFVVTWSALSFGGFVAVPINTAYQGRMLAQVVDDSAASVLICEAAYIETFEALDAIPRFHKIIVRGKNTSSPESSIDLGELSPEMIALPQPQDHDLMQILFTSGTTGRSKGVLMTQAHLFAFSDPTPAGSVTSDDRALVCLPLFHVAGQWCVYNSIRAGATTVIARRFSASSFWKFANHHLCTATLLLGVMADFLMKKPEGNLDSQTTVTHVRMVPVIPEVRTFESRFGVQTSTYYGSTEAGNVLNAPFGTTVPTGCGWPREGVEVRLVDEFDYPIAEGGTGELVLRTSSPWELTIGYLDLPEETAKTSQNGWLHTGDLFRVLPDGQFGFVDRVKDSLRRRGENVSSYEVEREVMAHAAALECAVVGVPSEHTEDEIYLSVVTSSTSLDERTLWLHLAERLPYFMVPRYIEFFESLPRTASQKVGKADLRTRGISQAWDSVAAGMFVTREGVRDSSTHTQTP